ncbi:MAG: hypothetical protein LAP21_10220 [Acidobacteriia bacterium]|nr:hypothetical protein [Terriglobia bacterium]
MKALRQLDTKLAAETSGARLLMAPAAPLPQWRMIGPQPANWPLNAATGVSGRVTALAVDPRNANVVYLGGAEGGVWKTTDGGTTWLPLTDAQPSLAVGSITLDPSAPDTVYVGTGEANETGDAYFGAGILKSTDGGATWVQLPGPFASGTELSGTTIDTISVHPTNRQILLASVATFSPTTPGGIYRSADGGNTWTNVLSATIARDGIFEPISGNVAWAAIEGVGVYKSTNAGLTWSPANGTGANVLPSANLGRIEIAIAPSSTSTLYAGIGNSSGSALGIYKTVDAGVNWQSLQLGPAAGYCGYQCGYNNVIAVDPVNANVVYVGGQSPSLFRSLDGGTTWAQADLNEQGYCVLHADAHALAFSFDGARLYTGNDGGVWSTSNVADDDMGWSDLNSTLALTQFYPGISIHPVNLNIGFGGTQDNGVQKYNGGTSWQYAYCGDAGRTAIDPANPNNVYVECTSSYPVSWKSADGGVTFNPLSNVPSYCRQLTVDPSIAQRLYCSTTSMYQSNDGGATWLTIASNLTGQTLTAVAVAPGDPNTVYVGSAGGLVNVSTNAGSGTGATWTSRSTGLPNRVITRIVVDPVVAATAYVVVSGFQSGHVFKTTNAGVSWSNISGDLPDIPVNDAVLDPDVPGTLYVATDIGVFSTSNGGQNWSAPGSGLPRVVVVSLALHHPTRTLRAATHGRSAWDLTLGTPAPDFNVSAVPPSVSVIAGNNAVYTVTVTAVSGFTGTVGLSVAGLPTGATSGFNPASIVNAGSSTLTITTTAGVAAGTYPLTITGTSGSLTHTAAVTLVVTAPVRWQVTLSPASATVRRRNTATTTCRVSSLNGWSGTVTLSATNLPTGVRAVFGRTSLSVPANSSASTSLQLQTSSNTPVGTYSINVNATNGGVIASAIFTLTVN